MWDQDRAFNFCPYRKAKILLAVNKEFFSFRTETTLKILSNVTRIISRRMRNANTRILGYSAQYESARTRPEHDLLGYRDVPYEAYYGIQTLRAVENFNISGITLNFFPALIDSLAMVKESAAKAT